MRCTPSPRGSRQEWRMIGAALLLVALCGCGSGGGSTRTWKVTSLADEPARAGSALTLRAAIEQAASGDRIAFDRSLDGGTIQLTHVAAEHTLLPGEIYSGNTFVGYGDRDYGRSALFAAKSVLIDADDLPRGITIRWSGDEAKPARVLAVRGDLTLKNVTIQGGHSKAEAIAGSEQPFTLARGGGLAVWGKATLIRCAVIGNRCTGDPQASRDRGTYGGGIYANGLDLQESTISGNIAVGYGAAGGGIYSVGGADNAGGVGNDAYISRCAITGNRVTAQHAYGGGIFSLAGGPSNLATLKMTSCTVARNLVEDHPDLPQAGPYYYRGGGIYLGGGSLALVSCTVTQNEVRGPAAVFSGKPNGGGGGIAATIGTAHTVENMFIRQSIVAGNQLNGAPEDLFTGSLLHFFSQGYNRLGVLDFRYILVPVPDWGHLCRRHYPAAGDRDGVSPGEVLDLATTSSHSSAVSAGTDAGQPALLWIAPGAASRAQVPRSGYEVRHVYVGYTGFGVPTDDFLNHVLARLRSDYASILGTDFGAHFGDMTGVTWYGPAVTWTTNPQNAAWIAFWNALDAEIGGRLGAVPLGDDFWARFAPGPLGETLRVYATTETARLTLTDRDQLGRRRPVSSAGCVGAIER